MPAVTSHYAFAHTVLPWFFLQAEERRAERFESLRRDGGEQVLREVFESGARVGGGGSPPVATIESFQIVLRRDVLMGLPVLLFEFPAPKFPGESYHAAAVLRQVEGHAPLVHPAVRFFALDAPTVSGDPVLREAVREGEGLAWRRLRIAPASDPVTFRALLLEQAARLREPIDQAAGPRADQSERARCTPLLARACEYLERSGYRYTFSDDLLALRLGFARAQVHSYQILQCDPARGRLLATACPGVEIPAERRAAVAELLARLNGCAALGGFEVDFDKGIVRYRIALDTHGRRVTEQLLGDLVEFPGNALNAAWPAIAGVAAGELAPGEAFAKAAAARPAGEPAAVPAAGAPAPLRARVAAWLNANRLHYWIEQPAGLVGLNFKGKNGDWHTIIDCRETAAQVVARATAQLEAPPRARARAIELAARLNDRLALGPFDFDPDTGKISARVGVRAGGDDLTDALVESLVYVAGDLLDRYLPAIRDVVEIDAAPALALARLEQPPR
jgi:hypothetical protein